MDRARPARWRAPRARRRRTNRKRTDAPARNFGRGCNRIQAREITPSVPSEPINMRSGLGPAPEPGKRRVSRYAARRHHAQAFDEIVDMRIEAGEMAARPGRDPAAQRRIFETLRKMPQRDAMRLELVFQRRTIGAAFDQRGARGLIDLDDLAEIAQVERDGRLVAHAIGARLDTAADARTAAERRQRGARRRRPSPSRRKSRPRCGDRRRRRARNRSRRAWRARNPDRICRRRARRGRSGRWCRRRQARPAASRAARARRDPPDAAPQLSRTCRGRISRGNGRARRPARHRVMPSPSRPQP